MRARQKRGVWSDRAPCVRLGTEMYPSLRGDGHPKSEELSAEASREGRARSQAHQC